jgi:hypothetical protein
MLTGTAIGPGAAGAQAGDGGQFGFGGPGRQAPAGGDHAADLGVGQPPETRAPGRGQVGG